MVKNLMWVTNGTNVRDVKDPVGSVHFDVPHNACIYVRLMHVMSQKDGDTVKMMRSIGCVLCSACSLSNAYQ